MEIPDKYKSLYNHWEKHAEYKLLGDAHSNISIDDRLYSEIMSLVNERMCIWKRKSDGASMPYTDDPILSKYRFCNIYRELDRQTVEIHTMLKGVRNDFPLWLLNTAFLRYLCRPETYREVGSLSFDRDKNLQVLQNLSKKERPRYGSAYVFPVSTIMKSPYPTREEFFCLYLPEVMEDVAQLISSQADVSVCDLVADVTEVFGFNHKFHWTEILIDTAYQFPEYIDLFKKFPIGPGSIPTMKMFSDELPEDVCLALVQNQFKHDYISYLEFEGKPIYLSAENFEGIGCEYRKYYNLSRGSGRKRKYTPHGSVSSS